MRGSYLKKSTFCVWWKLYLGKIICRERSTSSRYVPACLILFVLYSSVSYIIQDIYIFFCSRPSEDRTIPLTIIAEKTKLSIEDVEYLLMKSLSVSITFFALDLSSFVCCLSNWVGSLLVGKTFQIQFFFFGFCYFFFQISVLHVSCKFWCFCYLSFIFMVILCFCLIVTVISVV